MRLTRTLRGLLMCAVVFAALLAGGCSLKAKAATPASDITGLWEMESAKGRAASLSEIGFAGDGTFKHSGNNALGRPVTFGGVYAVGETEQGSVIQLKYDDFPDRPTRWFYTTDGKVLRVSVLAEDLDTENALEFQRIPEQ